MVGVECYLTFHNASDKLMNHYVTKPALKRSALQQLVYC